MMKQYMTDSVVRYFYLKKFKLRMINILNRHYHQTREISVTRQKQIRLACRLDRYNVIYKELFLYISVHMLTKI